MKITCNNCNHKFEYDPDVTQFFDYESEDGPVEVEIFYPVCPECHESVETNLEGK